jgi:hypothetical protein
MREVADRNPATYDLLRFRRQDWRSTGFEHVATVATHLGDDEAFGWSGMDWEGLVFHATYHLEHHPSK